MNLFTKKKQNELIDLRDQLDNILKNAPLLIANSNITPKIETVTTSREIRYLKKQIWKFYRR